MSTIAGWVTDDLNGEPVEAVVIGRHYNDPYRESGTSAFNGAPIGKVMSWAEAEPFLKYEFDSGYGGADCHPVFVWTPTRVLFVTEYDGATGLSSVPRHPVACQPSFGGTS